MKAIVFDGYGSPEVLRLAVAEDPAPGDGELLIRVAAAAVNPADYKWRQGMFKDTVPLAFPHILGYDVAGTVDRVGINVGRFSVGDRVVGMLDPVVKGGYAELAVLSADATAKVPDSLGLTVAAAIPTAGLTGVQMIEEQIQPRAGDRVLITGACGAVGRFAVHAARSCGACIIAGVRAGQEQLARESGAEEVVVLGGGFAGAPFDHVADTVGGAEVAALCRHLVPGGRIRTAATTTIEPTGLPAEPEFFAVHPDAGRLAELLDAVAAGRIRVSIARRLPLSAAAEAHRLVVAGGLGGKVILEP